MLLFLLFGCATFPGECIEEFSGNLDHDLIMYIIDKLGNKLIS